ncbi:MAG: substrate-binding domain-containing protein [Marinospirillum sp.]|uniref:substrate-binding domain-containing protein n=1 Tax=Marinospirillum sp. TaxID=2183934 RepID=UPI0019EC0490|nr:substrate-binding domain-containing protein [Marinospirillum sp.]MBE0507216.1 substrate-binding domain-containing protein [Marinospirillum sp.]
MKKSNLTPLLLFTLLFSFCLPLSAADIIRLATTTSTYNSGLLDHLLPHFEKKQGVKVQVLSVGTGQALKLGQDGDVDLVMTHAPAAEEAFVEAGYGIEPRSLMYNDFVLVGPKNDPLQLAQSEGVLDAIDRIRLGKGIFISRGDDSGTHKKELELWALSGNMPDFSGYRAVGQGMGKVLLMASEMQGYTLTDRGTWLALRSKLDLQLLVEGSVDLANPYQVILVNPKRHPSINQKGARQLRDWLISKEGQTLIGNFQINGEQLFFPDAH